MAAHALEHRPEEAQIRRHAPEQERRQPNPQPASSGAAEMIGDPVQRVRREAQQADQREPIDDVAVQGSIGPSGLPTGPIDRSARGESTEVAWPRPGCAAPGDVRPLLVAVAWPFVSASRGTAGAGRHRCRREARTARLRDDRRPSEASWRRRQREMVGDRPACRLVAARGCAGIVLDLGLERA